MGNNEERTSQLNASQLARMVEISRNLNSATNLDVLLTEIIREAAALIDTEAASILLLDNRTRQLHFKASSNPMSAVMLETPVPLENSIAGAIFQANQPMIIEDVTTDVRWNPDVDQAIQFQTSSILGVPMHDAERVIGVLEALNKRNGRFSAEDVEMLGILADIAGVAVEKARLIEELRQAYAELNELDQMKTDFIAVASHELKTPLAVILGYVSFLRDDAGPEMVSQLDSVLQAAVRLRGLIQQMLNFEYADAAAISLNRESVDFVELVRDLAVDENEALIARGLNVAINLPGEPVPVIVDRRSMSVVLGNIADNAIKFTPEGGQINITVERVGQEVWLKVSDTGVGIPEDKLDRIFRRFYQAETHMRRRFEGMGLGLAVARDLIEAHGGRIWAENRVPQGSTFFVVLPLSSP